MAWWGPLRAWVCYQLLFCRRDRRPQWDRRQTEEAQAIELHQWESLNCLFMCFSYAQLTAQSWHSAHPLYSFLSSLGWQRGNCSVPCPPGTWGFGCNSSCQCAHEGVCSPQTGACTCTPGWHGAHCQFPCPVSDHSPPAWGRGVHSTPQLTGLLSSPFTVQERAVWGRLCQCL